MTIVKHRITGALGVEAIVAAGGASSTTSVGKKSSSLTSGTVTALFLI